MYLLLIALLFSDTFCLGISRPRTSGSGFLGSRVCIQCILFMHMVWDSVMYVRHDYVWFLLSKINKTGWIELAIAMRSPDISG
jgi:hypothetical protein